MTTIIRILISIISFFLFSFSSSAAVVYIHTDALGSVIGETRENGWVTKRYQYEPFGKGIGSHLPTSSQPGYTGHFYDADSGLNYMKARFYDPEIGRFYSPDPVSFIASVPYSFNRYSYANNNPYKYIDSTGGYVELPLEILSIGLGSQSFISNIHSGHYLAATIDALGLVFDIGAATFPGTVGAAGIGIASLRSGSNLAGDGKFLYRGVSASHPALDSALSGKVIPGNINGSISSEAHNMGTVSSDSPYTSWTRDIAVALFHANKNGPGGALLRVPEGKPPEGASWSWHYSEDVWFESEYLMKGIREGVDVLTDFNSFDNWSSF